LGWEWQLRTVIFNPFFLAFMDKLGKWLWFAALLAAPLVLWALPSTSFDNTGITLCPSKLLLNLECLGCGLTRAVMHLHHLEVERALAFNRGVVVAYPMLVVVWVIWARNAANQLGLLNKNMTETFFNF
jgi:Protein of unknown function (DUF2752)